MVCVYLKSLCCVLVALLSDLSGRSGWTGSWRRWAGRRTSTGAFLGHNGSAVRFDTTWGCKKKKKKEKKKKNYIPGDTICLRIDRSEEVVAMDEEEGLTFVDDGR